MFLSHLSELFVAFALSALLASPTEALAFSAALLQSIKVQCLRLNSLFALSALFVTFTTQTITEQRRTKINNLHYLSKVL
uniref:Putative ovule protein n=1 Tax=Solanum chacoense TaxID=4108 RepID=A0A0V0H4D3_SOLCH